MAFLKAIIGTLFIAFSWEWIISFIVCYLVPFGIVFDSVTLIDELTISMGGETLHTASMPKW